MITTDSFESDDPEELVLGGGDEVMIVFWLAFTCRSVRFVSSVSVRARLIIDSSSDDELELDRDLFAASYFFVLALIERNSAKNFDLMVNKTK